MANSDYTKKMYDKFAKEYHAKRNNIRENLWNRFLEMPAMTEFVEPIVKGKAVLDLGCGSGIFTKCIQSWGANVKGSDLSKNLIAIAKKENPKIQFTVCDAEKTPFKNSEFDIVTSGLVMHYIKDLRHVFKEVSRILKKDGTFVFSLTHPIAEFSERRVINGENIFVLQPYFNNDKYSWQMLDGMKLVYYHHTLENIVNTLNDSGFVVERLTETQPTKEFKKYDAKVYDRNSKYPSFMVIKARKVK